MNSVLFSVSFYISLNLVTYIYFYFASVVIAFRRGGWKKVWPILRGDYGPKGLLRSVESWVGIILFCFPLVVVEFAEKKLEEEGVL